MKGELNRKTRVIQLIKNADSISSMDGLFVLPDLLQRVQRRRSEAHFPGLRSYGLQTMPHETAPEEMSVRPDSDQHGFGVLTSERSSASARRPFDSILLLRRLSLFLFLVPGLPATSAAAHPRRIRPPLPIRQQMHRGVGDVLEASVGVRRFGIRWRRVECLVEADAEKTRDAHQLSTG